MWHRVQDTVIEMWNMEAASLVYVRFFVLRHTDKL